MYTQCTCLFFVYLVSRFVSHTDVKMHIEYICVMLLLTKFNIQYIIIHAAPLPPLAVKIGRSGVASRNVAK